MNVETILEKNIQSEISLSRVIDMNTCVLENEIFSGSNITSHGIPVVNNVNTAPPEYALPRLSSTNNSSMKRKSYDDFSTSIKNVMNGTLKRLVNPSIVRVKYFAFGEMIGEELRSLPPRQQIYSKKLMHDAMYIGILKKKINDEKYQMKM